MAIYRGIGGAGDSNTDATVTAVTEQATNAQTSATNAASSATSAASSASAASSSASSASTSATSASTSATQASSYLATVAASATEAAESATAAGVSETNAADSATAAATSETNAGNSAIAADASANDAATAEANAAASETASAASASAASTSATAAANSATAASTSATAASTSATNAATSETNAATSEANAATSATAASASAATATTKASEASTSATNAATSATNAATSETNAASSATAAASSATSASTSAATATTKASEAATSATNAATSETNAAASETAAAASQTAAEAAKDAALEALDSFDDRYLGQKTSDPTVDNDGNALVAGALYFNTTDDVMKVYEGSTWVAAYASLSGALLANNNLSDVLNVTAARTNLGLGTAATTASTDYATAAQGALADSALQSIPDNYILNTGDSITGDLSFGDNDKAVFGAGSDLQIYHDGTYSHIKDNGTGNLYIAGDNEIIITDAAENEYKARFNTNGSVQLYYDNSEKLATTSTGIDVTGTATMDGLTVDGSNVVLQGSTSSLDINPTTGQPNITIRSGNTFRGYIEGNSSGGMTFGAGPSALTRQTIASNGDISFYEDTGTTAKFFWDASAESLGIGTQASTTASLYVLDSNTGAGTLGDVGANKGTIFIANTNCPQGQDNIAASLSFGGATSGRRRAMIASYNDHATDPDPTGLLFAVDGSTGGSNEVVQEAMRIDSSGNLLVGKTATGLLDDGFEFRGGNGLSAFTRSSGVVSYFNRNTNDGTIIELRKDNSTVGSIGSTGGNLFVGSGDTGLRYSGGADNLLPWNTSTNASRDNIIDLGSSSTRFDDIYATNGTIQTSDANQKQDIAELDEAEQRVAQACKGLLRKFRWKDAVAEKGDDARIHFGIIAQDLQAAFEAEGLDAHRYAMFISTTWWEATEEVPAVEAVEATYDEEGNVLTEAVEAKEAYTRTEHYETAEEAPEGAVERTRLGVRYPELLAFIIATL